MSEGVWTFRKCLGCSRKIPESSDYPHGRVCCRVCEGREIDQARAAGRAEGYKAGLERAAASVRADMDARQQWSSTKREAAALSNAYHKLEALAAQPEEQRRITPAEARRLALGTMEDTDRALTEERRREAQPEEKEPCTPGPGQPLDWQEGDMDAEERDDD